MNLDPQPEGPSRPDSLYPAVCHLSVIVESRDGVREEMKGVLGGFHIVSPLAEGGGTPSGRHRAMRVSVRVASREELESLDRGLRAVPGVRMIL